MTYYLYTDGACQPNPGQGGWAFVLLKDDTEVCRRSGYEPDTTNNRMELTAVYEGMRAYTHLCLDGDPVTILTSKLSICSDSMYLINGIRSWSIKWRKNGWIKADKKPVLNQDLWEKIRDLADCLEITYTHIKGHSGHKYNEIVDQLAVESIHKHGLLSTSGN